MIDQARTLAEKQVRRVRRRLFAQIILHSVILGWGVALLAMSVWFLVRPFTFAHLDQLGRWSVPGILLGIGTLGGLMLAWMRQPSLIGSSLALDEKFGLQERVTSLMTLPADQHATPVGQALLRDVTQQLANLEVRSRFPLRLPAKQLLMPSGALVFALLALMLDPVLSDLKLGARTQAEQPVTGIEIKEIQQKMDELKKRVNEKEKPLSSEKLQELEKEFEKLLNQPLDTKSDEKIRERIAEMRKLEDKLKERMEVMKEKIEKIDLLKKQMQKLALDKDAQLKEGPAKDFEDALMKGQMNKAKDVLEKLAKDLKNDKLSKAKQKELADQFKKLQDKLQRLMDNDDFAKQLKQDAKDGKISPEQLQREMERFNDLKELADVLGETQENLGKLDGKAAGEKMEKLLERFRQIELTEDEVQNLLGDQQDIDEATRLLLASRRGREGDGDGDGEAGGEPGTRRRIDPNDPKSNIIDDRNKAVADPKGAQRIGGYAKGGNYNKSSSAAVKDAFQQAIQEAPEAIDRQLIPADAREISRKYFSKLGNQKD